MTQENSSISGSVGGNISALDNMSKSVIQAVYHQVTGKTENLKKDLKGNVIVRFSDLEVLNQKINQQIQHYDIIANPTTTVVVKTLERNTATYSTWERFANLNINTPELTSEILLKYEFLLKLPKTEIFQRCVISITIDSFLPLAKELKENKDSISDFEMIFVLREDYVTSEVSIEFVDFLIAKIFMTHIEGWFDELEPCPKGKISEFLKRHIRLIDNAISQSGRIAASVFLLSCALFQENAGLGYFIVFITLGLAGLTWSIATMVSFSVSRSMRNQMVRNILRSAILLTNRDISLHNQIIKERANSLFILIRVLGFVTLNVIINILSSYIYTNYL
jgi:hypothetical protein